MLEYPKNAAELKVFIFAEVMKKLNVFTPESTDKVSDSVEKFYTALGGDTYKNGKAKASTTTQNTESNE